MKDGALGSFLANNPWPPRMLEKGEPLEWLWEFEVGVSADDLWPYIIDTSRWNRAMGLSRIVFTEVDGQARGQMRSAGVLQEWVEIPWSWVARRSLAAVREYSRGFAWFMRGYYELEEAPGGRSRLRVYFGWIPRGPLSRLVLRVGFPGLQGGFERMLAALERHLLASKPEPSPTHMPAPDLSAEARSRLAEVAAEVMRRTEGRVAGDVVLRLVRHIESGDDMDLYRIKVRSLARALEVDPRDLLVVCLHATRLGLLTLTWDVICPHCRGAREEVSALGDVPASGSCAVCAIEFENDREESIEVTFHVHPSIRVVPEVLFCSAEPATKRHIEVQLTLAPGERRRVETALQPGVYRRRLHGERSFLPLEIGQAAPSLEIEWTALASRQSQEVGRRSLDAVRGLTSAPSPILLLENATDEPQTFVIEDVRWSDDAIRPADLFNLQEFRDLFARESVASNVRLSVGEQTIFFSDMVGSTRFYETQGDPAAFEAVRRHFTEIYEEVARHRGAVVKTIGDAAMAAFADPVDALRAASAVQARFHGGRGDTKVRVRISLNSGPCIAVNLNSAIDYFGRTVNLAAKLQGLAGSGQIVFPRAMMDAPGARAFFAAEGAALTELAFENKALDAPMPVYRWDTGERGAK